MAVTQTDFLQDLAASRLLSVEQLETVSLRSGEPANEVARRLVAEGRLTQWQAERILARQTGFHFGKYVLLQQLGQGGMGAVFQARQSGLDRLVAIKLMSKDLVRDAQALARFHREIEAAAALSHPNIVLALDADVVNGIPYLVMEYVSGEDLGVFAKRVGVLPWNVACEYCRQAAVGLQRAHERGMVHRDIKPGNLLLTHNDSDEPVVKILDFGLARFQSESREAGDITHTGQIIGTPDYISPEQAANTKTADIRSDIYSLGCTLYRLLTGTVPFPGNSIMERLMARATRDAEPISKFRSDLPAGLASVVQQAMARDPAQRYQTPSELAQALAPFCHAVEAAPVARVVKQPSGSTQLLSDEVSPTSTRVQTELLQFLAGLNSPPTETILSGETLSKGTRQRSSRRAPVKSKRNVAEVRRNTIIAAAVGLVVLVIAAVNAFQWFNRSTLIIDWPIYEREGGQLEIDGQSRRLSGQSTLIFTGSVGRRTARLSRQGYEPITFQQDLARGQTYTLQSEWKPSPQTRRKMAWAVLDRQIRAAVGKPADDAGVVDARRELLEFLRTDFGTPEAIEAVRAGSRLAWPIDRLQRSQIEPGELRLIGQGDPAQAPAELVGVFGNSRLAHWGKGGTVDRWVDDEHVVTIGADGVARVWNLSTFDQEMQFRFDSTGWGTDIGTWVALSPDRRMLAAGANGNGTGVKVWEVDSGREVFHFDHSAYPGAWSPDSTRLVVSLGPHTAEPAPPILVELSTQRAIRLGTATYSRMVFAPDGKHLLGVPSKSEAQIDVWTLDPPQVERTIRSTESPVLAIKVHPDPQANRFFVVTSEGPPAMLDIATGQVVPGWQAVPFAAAPVSGDCLDVHPSQRWLAVGGNDGTVQILDAATGAVHKDIAAYRHSTDHRISAVNGVRFTADGKRLVTVGANGVVQVWDWESGTSLRPAAGHFGPVTSLDVSPDGTQFVTGGFDGDIIRWDALQRSPQTRIDLFASGGRPSYAEIATLRFHPDGAYIGAKPGDTQMQLLDLPEFMTHGFPQLPIGSALAFSPDRRNFLISERDLPKLHLYDLEARRELRLLTGTPSGDHTDRIISVAFSPNGQSVVTAGYGYDRRLMFWNVADGRVLAVAPDLQDPTCLSFSPDGKWLALNPLGKLVVLNTSTRRAVPNYWSDASWTSFSPDGRFLAAISPAGKLILYETKEWNEARTVDLRVPNAVYEACWTPDSRHILTANRNGTVYALRLEPPATSK